MEFRLETTHKSPELNRRRLLLLGAGALAGMLASGGIDRRRVAASDDRNDTSPEPRADQDIETTPESQEGGPEALREAAEDSRETLFEEFQITTKQASTPEEFAVEYAARLEMALNAGCTPEEVAPFLENGAEGYEEEMSDKYDLAATRGIYGIPEEVSDEEIKSDKQYSHLYNSLVIAHKATLKRYLEASRAGSEDQAVEVSPFMDRLVDMGMNGEGEHLLTINLNVTDGYGELVAAGDSYGIEAPVTVGVDFFMDNGVCRVEMDPTVLVLFNQIGADE